jgi:P-type Ca2+ transporter type 2C
MPELLPWHHVPTPDALLALRSSLDGLSSDQVKERRKEFGQNVFAAKRRTPVGKIFWRQVSSPLMLVLMFAIGLSVILGQALDAILAVAVVCVNVIMGFAQEYQADRSLQALKQYLPSLAHVRRDGRVLTIAATEIVPGDIMLLSTGDKITADARVCVAQALATDESALTGESREVMKTTAPVVVESVITDQASMVFAGTTVVAGSAEVLVVATANHTEFGKLAQLVIEPNEQSTPLQLELVQLTRTLVGIMLAAAVGVFILGALRGISVIEMLSTSAALAVAAVPEGLLIGVTVILTVGMRRMLRRQALVHRLLAAETLGSVNILCVDKTGTLTTGKMTVTELRCGTELVYVEHAKATTRQFLRDVFSATSARIEVNIHGLSGIQGSPTEAGILQFLTEHKAFMAESQVTVLTELPFDSIKKYSAKYVRADGQDKLLVLGAPEIVLSRCSISDSLRREYHDTLQDMVRRGLRVVLLATKSVTLTDLSEDQVIDLVPVGMLGLRDPLRTTALPAMREAQLAGIRVMMLTGDHAGTALTVATELGLATDESQILTGQMLSELSDSELAERLRSVNVCARIQPEQKLRIVQILKSLGYIVAMTGDGVNDAPALRAADVGVAVGSGTEVAKDTADMVILDNNVKSIIAAVSEGRIIFDNLRKLVTYLLTFSLSEVALITGILILGFPVPFAPVHILWINLITDGLPSLALAFEGGEKSVMHEAPRARREPIISQGLRGLMLCSGAVAVIGLLLLYFVLHQASYPLDVIRTMLWLALGLDSLLAIYPLRSLRQPFWKLPSFQNPVLLAAVLSGVALLVVPILLPVTRNVLGLVTLQLPEIALVIGFVAIKILIIELCKAWFLFDVRKPRAVVS